MNSQSHRFTNEKLLDILAVSDNATAIYSGDEITIQSANDKMIAFWGKDSSIIGKPLAEAVPELIGQPFIDLIREVWQTGTTYTAKNAYAVLLLDGKLQPFYFDFIYQAIYNDAGKVDCILHTATDVTEFNLKLKTSKDEMLLAVDAAGLATFDFNPLTGRFAGNEVLKSWFGLEPDEEIELFKATNVIAEYDRERVISAIQYAMNYESGGDYDTNYTIVHPKHPEPRIVRAKGKVLFNEQHQAIRLSGVLQDVTEQINSQNKISDINNRLNIAIDAGSLGSAEVDLTTGIIDGNENFKKYFGRAPNDDFNYGDMYAAMLPAYRDHIRHLVNIAKLNHSVYKAEYEVAWPDGSIHWINAHGKARYDSNGNPIKMVGIIADITEVKQDEQRKNDFIAMVSHELKTPLTSLSGYVQMLHNKAKSKGDSFTAGALNIANKQVKKMTTMINGFLNVSRLESGKIHIDSQLFDMALLIKDAEEEAMMTINSHKITFYHTDEIFVKADRDKIGQVIHNLISNAVKYTPSGTTIHISCTKEPDSVKVTVKDEGMGIRPEDQEKLFERYYRVKETPVTIAGFGIGLYLCAEVIHRHKGKIWVESVLEKGATFYFTLPLDT